MEGLSIPGVLVLGGQRSFFAIAVKMYRYQRESPILGSSQRDSRLDLTELNYGKRRGEIQRVVQKEYTRDIAAPNNRCQR